MPTRKVVRSEVDAESLLKRWFGLRSYEGRVYLALLKGRRTPNEISAVSKVPLPRVYDTIRSLEGKGFIQRTADGPAANPPSIALESRSNQLEAEAEKENSGREQAKKRLIQSLMLVHRNRGEASDVMVLKGLYAIAERMIQIMSDSKEVFLLVRKGLEAKEFFLRYVTALPIKRMKIRVIIPWSARLTQDEKKLASKLGLQLRRHPNPLLDLVVADSRHVILGVPDPLSDSQDAVAVLVQNPSFAAALHESLETLWRESVKLG